MEELHDSPILQGLKGKNTFLVPDAYFEHLEEDIMSKIKASETASTNKRFVIGRQKIWLYAVAAVLLALFVFVAIRSGSNTDNQPKIANETEQNFRPQETNASGPQEPKPQLADTEEDSEEKEAQNNNIDKVPLKENNALAVESPEIIDPEQVTNTQEAPAQNKQQNQPEQITKDNYDLASNDTPLSTGTIASTGTSGNFHSTEQCTTKSLAAARKAVEKYLDLGEDKCSNSAIQLNALTSNVKGLRYLWSTKDTTATIMVQQSGNYWVEVFDLKGNLLGADTVKVRIVPAPKPNLGDDRIICNYESVLIASGCKNQEFTYQWSISDATTPEIYLTNLEPGTYDIVLNVMSCADTVSSRMLLTVKDCNIKIPNVITPNGDGRNDRFVIEGLEHYPGSQLHIFDRNGRMVYEALDYQNNWDAANIPDGTYFYRLQLNDGKNSEKNGTLTILRK